MKQITQRINNFTDDKAGKGIVGIMPKMDNLLCPFTSKAGKEYLVYLGKEFFFAPQHVNGDDYAKNNIQYRTGNFCSQSIQQRNGFI